MSDNFNIDTTQAQSYVAGGLDPNDPGQTLWESMNKNRLAQQEQEQLVQEAIEKVKQSKIETQEKQTEFDTQAYLSRLGMMQKSQALGQLKIVMQKQGVPDEDQASIMQTAETTFPEVLDGAAIWKFWSALREPKAAAATRGETFQATAADVARGQKDASGNPVVEGQGYVTNTDGDWVRSGKSQDQIDSENDLKRELARNRHGDKEAETESKNILKLNTTIDSLLKSRFGAVGMLATAIFRSVRAINTLQSNPNLSAQDLENVSTDIAGIYQGGVPPAAQATANQYKIKFLDFANTFRQYTGYTLNPSSWFHNKNDVRSPIVTATENKLLSTLNDMRTSSEQSLHDALESESTAFKLARAADPATIDQLIESKMKFIESGVLVPDSAHSVLKIGDKYTASGSVSIPPSASAVAAAASGATDAAAPASPPAAASGWSYVGKVGN